MSAAEKKIERAVEEKPGLSFSQLKEATGLSNGVIQHHLRNSDRITVEKGGIVREGFCSGCGLSRFCRDSCVLKELRKERTSEIVELLDQGFNQSEIARELGIDRSTVHYHVDKLRDFGIVEDGDLVIDPCDV